MERYGASRNVVREALRMLVEEKLLERRTGLGTRIVAQKFGHNLDRLAGLAETLLGQGIIRNHVRVVRWESASEGIARRLGIGDGDQVLFLERLRLLDGQPLSLDRSYLAADIGAALLNEDLEHQDVFQLIETITTCPLGTAEFDVQAINAEHAIAEVLDLAAGTAIFAIERLTRLADGRAVDAETIQLRGDRIALTGILHRAAGPSPANDPA